MAVEPSPMWSEQAEQSVLGGLMLDNTTFDAVAAAVDERDFYRRDHRGIYRAICVLAKQGKPFDFITLSGTLEAFNWLEEAGGLAYLATIAKDTPTAANVVAYAGIVRERSLLRQLSATGAEIQDAAIHHGGRSSQELIENAEQLVFKLADRRMRAGEGFKAVPVLLADVVDRVDEMSRRDGGLTGLATGYAHLDEMTAGLQKGDLVVVGGRPSMGKTSICMNMAERAALDGRRVAVFSLEMPGEQLVMRMLSSLGRINQARMRCGKLTDEEWPRLTTAVVRLKDTQLHIDSTASISVAEMRARCRRLSRSGAIDLIVVDYVQLMGDGGSNNRANELGDISRGLKSLAKEQDCPLLLISQLNRELERRPDKRPKLSDLRESGALEQDADLALFVYRDEVYNPDSPDLGTAEIIIAKHRNGPTGTVRLNFIKQFTRFEQPEGMSHEYRD